VCVCVRMAMHIRDSAMSKINRIASEVNEFGYCFSDNNFKFTHPELWQDHHRDILADTITIAVTIALTLSATISATPSSFEILTDLDGDTDDISGKLHDWLARGNRFPISDIEGAVMYNLAVYLKDDLARLSTYLQKRGCGFSPKIYNHDEMKSLKCKCALIEVATDYLSGEYKFRKSSVPVPPHVKEGALDRAGHSALFPDEVVDIYAYWLPIRKSMKSK